MNQKYGSNWAFSRNAASHCLNQSLLLDKTQGATHASDSLEALFYPSALVLHISMQHGYMNGKEDKPQVTMTM